MKVKDRIYLLDRLWELQRARGYLSDADMDQVSREFGLSVVEVEGVRSFYHFFQRQPQGKHTIYLNNSILSWFQGFGQVKAAFEQQIAAAPAGLFGLQETSCIGLSDREPAALIDFHPFTRLTPPKVRRILQGLQAGIAPAALADEVDEQVQQVPDGDQAILFREFVPGRALARLPGLTPEQVIARIREAGLSGRGGAFFPTAMKWELCRKAAGKQKYIVCNADEGEPGTFKDRALLNLLPGLLLEGMIVAGYAVGARQGIIYLRAEYGWLLPKLQQALAGYRQQGYLGRRRPGLKHYPFDIRVQLGAGAYICGEETSLLESMEGKRGEPRLKHFFPTEKGFRGRPTVVNNVETFCAAARIIELGAERFRALGTPASTGTKLLSLAGDCRRPGLYEIVWGMRLGELLEKCGAENPAYVQMSGPSGELIAATDKDRLLAGEDIRCGGSVMIFGAHRDLLTILLNFSRFFTHESCGLCTPCRAGNPQLLGLLEKLIRGHATAGDLDKMRQWTAIIRRSSRCGLGQTAPKSLEQALETFPRLFEQQVTRQEQFNPDFDLEQATHAYDQLSREK